VSELEADVERPEGTVALEGGRTGEVHEIDAAHIRELKHNVSSNYDNKERNK